jgi:PAS domain S-box-containing protein
VGLLADLERVRHRIDQDRSPDLSLENSQQEELETASEELRVASEELRVQQETIERLVVSHRELRLQQERTMSILPVPVLVTDRHGTIVSANAAAAVLAGRRAAHLLRKPVFSLFAECDRGDLRRMLAARRDGDLVLRRTSAVVPKVGDPISVQVMASTQLPGVAQDEISWILLAARDQPDGDPVGPVCLSEALTALATLPSGADRFENALPAAAAACRRALGEGVEVSLVLGSPLEPTSVASSSQAAQRWDGAQVAVGEGPSVTAYAEGRPVESGDAATDERWPALAEHVPEDGRSVSAAPVAVGDRVVGVLTVYGRGAGGPAHDEAVEVLAATLGGLAREFELMAELARTEQDMHRALASRSVIDQAKGIVMADRGVDAEAAWQHLVHLSSTQHVKVREVAEAIVARAAGRA